MVHIAVGIFAILLNSSLALAAYNQPPKEILDVMQAPQSPSPMISPTKDMILLVEPENFPSIERVATPYLKLAGVRIEPKNHSRHDTPGGYGIAQCVKSIKLFNIAKQTEIKVDISKLRCVDWPTWNSNGKYFAFSNRAESSVELFIGQSQTGGIVKVDGLKLNEMMGQGYQWMPDQKNILVKRIPPQWGNAPQSAQSINGPNIQETNGEKGQSSTYEKRDTLNNKHDEALFDYYGTSQLALIDVKTLKLTALPEKALFSSVFPSPDGQHILVTKIVKPYSYLTTFGRFPQRVEVLDISNLQKVSATLISERPLADRVPVHGVPMGPRNFFWKATDAATLFWVEALDGGDWNVKVPHRDKLMMTKAPFKKSPIEILKTEMRLTDLDWFEQADLALVYEEDDNKHWTRATLLNIDDPTQQKKILWDMSTDEKYADPGNPVYKRLDNGFSVIRKIDDFIFLAGQGYSPSGDRPFLDQLNIKTIATERLFRSDKTEFERFFTFSSDLGKDFFTWHQSVTDVPNVFLRTLKEPMKAEPGESTYKSEKKQVTQFIDLTPQVRKIKKRMVKYKRGDGLDLSFTLYTPPNYVEGTKLPTILYAYPLDYADASKAGQVSGSDVTFTRLRDYRLLLLAGYAILDNTDFPIVGDPKKAYDTYLEQLVANAKAAVDQALKMGVADPKRIGVTGHSHGALMVVNLLAHTDYFKAGVATSGSYNKTITPFGFQSERRSVWEAPEVYRKVSPYFVADRLKAPLLIIHGADDANPGTTPMQATFLYEAIRGNGGVARLVMLPHEPHWYTARESNEQEIYEMLNWFNKYL